MEFYTNVLVRGNSVLYRGYKDGRRVMEKIPYSPYLFVPSNDYSEYRTLDDKFVKRMDFETIREAKDFIEKYKDVDNFEIFGMDRFVYPFINDNFPGQVEYDISKIRVINVDIETESEGGFPDIDLANKMIELIGIGIGKSRVVFGLQPYTPKNENHKFVKCRDETELLSKFLDAWNAYDPDVVTGWNIDKFDIPYMVNRIRRVMGEEHAKRLSPWKQLQEKNVEIYGKIHRLYVPLGVSVLDYYDLYRKFTYTQLESYSLDHVSFVETGRGKLDYSEYETLSQLSKLNYEKYVDYNIVDIDRVADIDEKNKFIELVYAIAYDAKINFADALTSVLLWDVIIHNYLMERRIVVPFKHIEGQNFSIEGAYVKEPVAGFYEWVVSFDLTSLYPHLIMQYNISPETFVKMLPACLTKLLNGEDIEINEEFAYAANGACYSKRKRGFLAELMELQFKQRVDYKNKMLDAKRQFEKTKDPRLENDIARYNNAQMAKKVQLNSAYGAIANPYFRFFNVNNAEAITVSGQLSIQWVQNKLNEFFNKSCGTKDADYVIAADTDSVYLNLGKAVQADKLNVDTVNEFCETIIQPVINRAYEELAIKVNAYTNAMKMKRESIADKGIWTAKKRYILNVLDNEGVRYCMDPSTKVLTKELFWKNIGDLSIGEELVGFDENHNGSKNAMRKFKSSIVTHTELIELPSFLIKMKDGTEHICSSHHKWLVRHNNRFVWRETHELNTQDSLIKLFDVWDTDTDYDSGYLSAAFDGEGYISQSKKDNGGYSLRIGMSQRNNIMLEEVERCLIKKNFSYGKYVQETINQINLTGKRHESIRFLGQIRPKRLLEKFDVSVLGRMTCKEIVGISSIEFIGNHPVIVLSTSSKTFIANGYATHNCEPKLKMMGIEAIRSSTPQIVRKYITETLKLVMSKKEIDVQLYIKKCKAEFKSLRFDEVAFPRGINGLDKYFDRDNIHAKGAPIHVRAALVYNNLLKKNGLSQRYELIHDKDKLKWSYLRVPNKYHSDVIGAQKTMPAMFEIEKYIDYDLMFQKSFIDPITKILSCIGWKPEKKSTLEAFLD